MTCRGLVVGLVLVTSLCAAQVPASAKVVLVAVFPLRSTAELSSQATAIAGQIVARIAAIDGYDAKALGAPTGSHGDAAAAAGAEIYVQGQIVDNGSGYRVTASAFSTATDKELGEQTIDYSGDTLPSTFNAHALIVGAQPPDAAGTAPSASPGFTLDDVQNGISQTFTSVSPGNQGPVTTEHVLALRAAACTFTVSTSFTVTAGLPIIQGQEYDDSWSGRLSDVDVDSLKSGKDGDMWDAGFASNGGAKVFDYRGEATGKDIDVARANVSFGINADPKSLLDQLRILIGQCTPKS